MENKSEWRFQVDIILEIEQRYNTFSQKEKELANYILNSEEGLRNINITVLAEKIGVSPSTITRFSKKVNCESFVDMKMKINLLKEDVKGEGQRDLFSDVHSYYSEVIERSRKLLNEELIHKMVRDLESASKIYIYGIGSSGMTAQEMMQRLIRMGFNVYSITDPHMMIINSVVVSPDDLVIGISNSGTTREIIESLKICRKNKAKIIGITSWGEGEICEYSDELIVLPNTSYVGRERFINTQFSIMYLFDLVSMVLLKDPVRRKKMQMTIEAITN